MADNMEHYGDGDHLRWQRSLPMSAAVRAGELVFVGGQTALGANSEIVHAGDVVAQTCEALRRVGDLVEDAGGTLDDIVDLVTYHRDARDIDKALVSGRKFFGSQPPAWTPVGMVGTYHPDALVVVRAIAHLGEAPKTCVRSPSFEWSDDLPISGACRKGSLVFVSGQTAATGDGIDSDSLDHVGQARVAYSRIRDHLELAGATVDDVLDFTSMHQDIRGAEPTFTDAFQPDVLAGVDPEHAPTTSHVGMPAMHHAGVLGTYRALADVSPGARQGFTPESIWWKGILPISGGAKKGTGRILTIAGQVACDSEGNVIAPGNIQGQAQYVMDCIQEIVEGAGGSLGDVVEITSFHKDPRYWRAVLDVASGYFARGHGPAWTAVGSTGLWWEGYLHEVAALAVI